MSKRSIRHLIGGVVLGLAVFCGFSEEVSAYSNENEPVTEAYSPEEKSERGTNSKEKIKSGDFRQEGNAYARDLNYDKETNKQFITVQTKNGNTFYIVIDYDAPVKDREEQYQTYFLNMVDEGDLLALMDEDAVSALKTCICKDKCVVGHIDTECPVCKTNMVECEGVEMVPEPPAEEPEIIEPEPEEPVKKSGAGILVAVLIFAGLGGGAYYYFKFIRKGKPNDEDMDFFDDEGYEEEPYINEDEENSDDEVSEEVTDEE